MGRNRCTSIFIKATNMPGITTQTPMQDQIYSGSRPFLAKTATTTADQTSASHIMPWLMLSAHFPLRLAL